MTSTPKHPNGIPTTESPPAFGPNSPRRLPLKVIVCGVGRTGTTSMQAALETLGFPTFHATSIWHSTRQEIALWNRALDAKHRPASGAQPLTQQGWDVLLGGYSAVIEVSAVKFAADLAEIYPDAKVVVVDREPESWFRSCVGAFTHSGSGVRYHFERLLFQALAVWDTRYKEVAAFMARKQGVAYGFEWFDRDAKPKALVWREEYYKEMREKIPVERMLEYSVKEGWDPLCEFLGVEVPTVVVGGKRVTAAFPSVNAAKGFKGTMFDIHREVARAGVRAWAVRIAFGYLAWSLARPYLAGPLSEALRILRR